MKKRLNYRKLLRSWMQFYEMSAEMSKKVLASILARLQNQKINENGGNANEVHMERADRKSST